MKFVNENQSYLQVTKLREVDKDGTMQEYLRIEIYEKETGISVAMRLQDPRIIDDVIEVANSVRDDLEPSTYVAK